MNTKVVTEVSLLTLFYSDYNTSSQLEIYATDLKAAEVGKRFTPDANRNCGRGVCDEQLTVVYKDSHGIACIFEKEGTSDSPNPEDWKDQPELIWFDLHQCDKHYFK